MLLTDFCAVCIDLGSVLNETTSFLDKALVYLANESPKALVSELSLGALTVTPLLASSMDFLIDLAHPCTVLVDPNASPIAAPIPAPAAVPAPGITEPKAAPIPAPIVVPVPFEAALIFSCELFEVSACTILPATSIPAPMPPILPKPPTTRLPKLAFSALAATRLPICGATLPCPSVVDSEELNIEKLAAIFLNNDPSASCLNPPTSLKIAIESFFTLLIGRTFPAMFTATRPPAISPNSLGCLSANSPRAFNKGSSIFKPAVNAVHDSFAIKLPAEDMVVKKVFIWPAWSAIT